MARTYAVLPVSCLVLALLVAMPATSVPIAIPGLEPLPADPGLEHAKIVYADGSDIATDELGVGWTQQSDQLPMNYFVFWSWQAPIDEQLPEQPVDLTLERPLAYRVIASNDDPSEFIYLFIASGYFGFCDHTDTFAVTFPDETLSNKGDAAMYFGSAASTILGDPPNTDMVPGQCAFQATPSIPAGLAFGDAAGMIQVTTTEAICVTSVPCPDRGGGTVTGALRWHTSW